MVDGVPIATLDGLGVVGVVLLFGIGMATGRLFTKRQYDEAIHDRDEWRAESRLKDAQIAEKDKQLGHMGEVGRNFEAVMGALQKRAREVDGEEEGPREPVR